MTDMYTYEKFKDSDSNSSTVADAAREYIERGFAPIPVPYGEKGPTIPGWQNIRLTLAECEQAFGRAGTKSNIGIILGSASGNLVDVDLDSAEAVELAPTFLSPTGMIHGRASKPRSHWYYRTDTPMKRKPFAGPAGESGSQMIVEIRGDGAQTIAPPSVHPSGERIEWDAYGDPAHVDASELMMQVQRLAAAALLASHWKQGIRQHVTLALSGALLRSGWDTVEVERFVQAVAEAASDNEVESRVRAVWDTEDVRNAGQNITGIPTLSELLGSEVTTKITSWLNLQSTPARIMEPEPDLHLTDLGNAERLVRSHGADIRYCPAWDKWLVWDGKRWKIASTYEIVRLATLTVRDMYREAAGLTDDAKRRDLVNHARTSESQPRLNAMVQLAKSVDGVLIEPSELDQHPFLLNVLNGTIDLSTMQLRPHQRDDMLTKIMPVEFDPSAPAPRWEQFLSEIMDGNVDMIQFLQRAVGYSLAGVVRDRALFILYGSGANGKTVFLETIDEMLGEYAMATRTETLLVKREGAVSNDVARLAGARYVHASEADQGKQLSEALIKQITGGDTLVARFLFQESFEFQPTFKVWLGTNHKPDIRGTDPAIWERIKLIPFTVTIPVEQRVARDVLMDRFRSEMPGILNWALAGCSVWMEQGLIVPKEVERATSAYRAEMDVLELWLNEGCVVDSSARVPNKLLFESYQKWCIANGESPSKQRPFSEQMKERAFVNKRTGDGYVWHGVGLVTRSPVAGMNTYALVNQREPVSRSYTN